MSSAATLADAVADRILKQVRAIEFDTRSLPKPQRREVVRCVRETFSKISDDLKEAP